MARCNSEKAAQELTRRALAQRIAGIENIMRSHLDRWASSHGQPRSTSLGSAFGQGAGVAASELAGAIGRGIASYLPAPPPLTDTQGDQVLWRHYNRLLLSGVDPVRAEKIAWEEACLLDVPRMAATGELVKNALVKQ